LCYRGEPRNFICLAAVSRGIYQIRRGICQILPRKTVGPNNEYLLRITGCHELVAVEAKYHRSCYQKCIRVTDEHGKQCVDVTAEVQTDEPTTKAFQFITNYLERMVFGVKNIVALSEIANVYVAKLLEYGHPEVCDSTKRNLRRKLEHAFEDRLNFCNASNGRVLLWPDSLTMDELVIENH